MTIYALSSGSGVSGIAVIRISGKNTSSVLKLLTKDDIPKPRVATLKKINNIKKQIIGIITYPLIVGIVGISLLILILIFVE